MLAGRVSIRTTCGCWSRSSAASSIVATRSSSGMNDERALSSVVLPLPVPPEMIMLIRAWMHAERNSIISGVSALLATRSSISKRPGAEAADRQQRAVKGQRRNDRVDAAAVGQPGVDHRAGLVDPPADPAGDPLDDLEQVPLVVERHVDTLQPAVPLDVGRLGAVDHDVA